MEGHGVLPVLYLSSWLLTSFGSDFPLFFSSRVLDVVLTGSYPHAVLKVFKSDKPVQLLHLIHAHLHGSLTPTTDPWQYAALLRAFVRSAKAAACCNAHMPNHSDPGADAFLPCWLCAPPPKSV